MAFTSTYPTQAAVSVTSSATKLLDGAGATRKAVTIQNNGAVTVYLGDSAVTAANGIPLAAGSVAEERDFKGAMYAITSSGTADVRVKAA